MEGSWRVEFDKNEGEIFWTLTAKHVTEKLHSVKKYPREMEKEYTSARIFEKRLKVKYASKKIGKVEEN